MALIWQDDSHALKGALSQALTSPTPHPLNTAWAWPHTAGAHVANRGGLDCGLGELLVALAARAAAGDACGCSGRWWAVVG
eukprot:7094557-Prymnesium_polylepis.1